MAIDQYTVNGTALVSVGTGGGGALETLGYTDNGVDIFIEEHKGQIITDVMGPAAPQDFQDFGMTARIVVNLVAQDSAVFAKIINRGDRTAIGEMNTPGLVLGAAGYLFRVGIASPFALPWSFNKCVLRPGHGTKLATKLNPYRIEFFALPYALYSVTAGKDTPVFTRSLS